MTPDEYNDVDTLPGSYCYSLPGICAGANVQEPSVPCDRAYCPCCRRGSGGSRRGDNHIASRYNKVISRNRGGRGVHRHL